MTFETFFRLTSYLVVMCGFLALFVSGSVGVAFSGVFLVLFIVAWFLESTNWQLSERVGTALVILTVPLFYFTWRFRLFGAGGDEAAIAGLLSRFILGLSIVKLLQRKRDRDWLFLYMMAFFEVLLSAAMSVSPVYLAVLVLFLFFTAIAVLGFEIGKSSRALPSYRLNSEQGQKRLDAAPFRRLPTTAILLIVAVIVFAAPIFFLLPRVGGAGFGAGENGVRGMTGFSDSVRLGELGRILESDETVMRVKVDVAPGASASGFRWRGVALDQFDNKTWKQSRKRKQSFFRADRDVFLVGPRMTRPKPVLQTIYLEPMDSNVLFSLAHPVMVQGNFLEVRKDEDDGLSATRSGNERINYSVQSDLGEPSPERLRSDDTSYSADEVSRFLQLPDELDPGISALAAQVTGGSVSRFDKARAIESYLQKNFGYTLEQKSSGEQPVADFLFNVREGHCEYFSSAMVLMLRTQGIAARVVNGFQQGEFNDTAGVFVVKQKDAHSWVEVYFPRDRVWIAFDPTPFAGRADYSLSGGLLGQVSRYLDALETFWIQYFVAFDNHEQRSLFRSIRDGFNDFQNSVSIQAEYLQARISEWWSAIRGDRGIEARLSAVKYGVVYVAGIMIALFASTWLYKRLNLRDLAKRILMWLRRRKVRGIVEFYDRMTAVLSRRGLNRDPSQTPLEFAVAVGIPAVGVITDRYNRVRFGGADLTESESEEIERLIVSIEDQPHTSKQI